jgi:HNH endonuclease
VEALAPDRYLIKFTASAATCEKLRAAQDLLQHAIPARDVAEVIDRALTVLIEHLACRKFAATASPRAPRDAADGSRNIPAWVRRAVWIRDGGRCAFVSKGGRRCSSRSCLEFHHVIPYEVGGLPTIDNIQLRCRAHNGYEADVYFKPLRAAADEPATRPGASSPSAPGTAVAGVDNMPM